MFWGMVAVGLNSAAYMSEIIRAGIGAVPPGQMEAARCLGMSQDVYKRQALRFENEGRTIPPEKLARVFEQFFRLDSARGTSTGGAGLGLAIAKQIVEQHGGAISAASADNKVEFTVTLPPAGTP